MNEVFYPDEKLYRAIYPPEIAPLYWKRDGSISYTAFIDPNGLSVDRGDYREDSEVRSEMSRRLTGSIVKFYVRTCNEIGAYARYLPSKHDQYHSEVHGSKEQIVLSTHQCVYLDRRVVKV